jgi:hypothetical protein
MNIIHYLSTLIIFACLLFKHTTFAVLSCTSIFHCQTLKTSSTCIHVMYYVVSLSIVLYTDVTSRPVGNNSKEQRPNLIHPKSYCLTKCKIPLIFEGGGHEALYMIFHFTKTWIITEIYSPFHRYLMVYDSFWYVYYNICRKPLSYMPSLKYEVSLPVTPKRLYCNWWEVKKREIPGFEYI